MCGYEAVGDAQEALGNDPCHFETVEVLVADFRQDSLQRALNLFRTQGAKEHHLHFCCDEEEVPSGGVDLAVEGKAIEGSHNPPIFRVGIALEGKNAVEGRPFFDEDRANFGGLYHKSFAKSPRQHFRRVDEA